MKKTGLKPFNFSILASATTILCLVSSSAFSNSDLSVALNANTLQQIGQSVIDKKSNPQKRLEKALPDRLEMKKVDVNTLKLPEIVKVYGKALFGLNFEEKSELQVVLEKTKIEGQITIENIDLSQPKGDSKSLEVELTVSIRDPELSIPQVTVREKTITSQLPLEKGSCNANHVFKHFHEQKIWTELHDISLDKKSANASKHPLLLKVKGKLDTVPGINEQQIVVEKITHNFKKVLDQDYQIGIREVLLPPISIKVDGVCYPADTSGIDAFFRGHLEEIKVQIVAAASQFLVKDGLEKINEALKDIQIPTDYSLVKKREHTPLTPKVSPTVSDNTSIQHAPLPLEITKLERSAEKTKVSMLDKLLKNFAYFSYHIGLDRITIPNSKLIVLGAKDEIAADFISMDMDNAHAGALDATLVNDFDAAISVSKDFIDEKLQLVEKLRLIQNEMPAGVYLGKKGITTHIDNNKFSAVAEVVVVLPQTEGLMAKIGCALEVVMGDTKCVLHIPLQINITPFVDAKKNKVGVKLSLRDDFNKTEYGEKSNLGDAFSKVRSGVVDKLKDMKAKVEAIDASVDQSLITNKSGLVIKSAEFKNQQLVIKAKLAKPNVIVDLVSAKMGAK